MGKLPENSNVIEVLENQRSTLKELVIRQPSINIFGYIVREMRDLEKLTIIFDNDLLSEYRVYRLNGITSPIQNLSLSWESTIQMSSSVIFSVLSCFPHLKTLSDDSDIFFLIFTNARCLYLNELNRLILTDSDSPIINYGNFANLKHLRVEKFSKIRQKYVKLEELFIGNCTTPIHELSHSFPNLKILKVRKGMDIDYIELMKIFMKFPKLKVLCINHSMWKMKASPESILAKVQRNNFQIYFDLSVN
jgi:hypothetical protein